MPPSVLPSNPPETGGLGRRLRGVRKVVVASYCAALLSLVSGLIRDAAVVAHSADHARFFEILYLGGLCSLVAVNSVMLSATAPGAGSIAGGILVSMALLLVGWAVSGLGGLADAAMACSVVACWVIGAAAARAIMAAGRHFLGRMREAAGSLVLATLVALGASDVPALLAGTAVSTLAWVAIARRCPRCPPDPHASPGGGLRMLERVVLSNVGTASMLLWALHYNSQASGAWGLESPIVVRASMYAFQVTAVGWPILSTSALRVSSRTGILASWTLAVCAIAGIASSLAGLAASSVAMPIAASLAQYLAIVLMIHRHRGAGGESTIEAQ
jgi:hypothetical protein